MLHTLIVIPLPLYCACLTLLAIALGIVCDECVRTFHVSVVVNQQTRVLHEWYVVRRVGRPWYIRLYDHLFFRIKGF